MHEGNKPLQNNSPKTVFAHRILYHMQPGNMHNEYWEMCATTSDTNYT